MRKIDTVVLHHTAGTQGFEAIRNDHRGRGWSDIFYHFVIERDGTVRDGRHIDRHASRSRRSAIEIALVGNLHLHPPSKAQEKELVRLLEELTILYDIENWYNHLDLDNTICPGKVNINNYVRKIDNILNDLEGGEEVSEERISELEARVASLLETREEFLKWREDLRAFIHRKIVPRIVKLEAENLIPSRPEGTE